ncbi:Leucine carboxyl methyltransferase 1 [Armadillidium nasatum]|uniref:Leucine carboxyl methyltransferase 1 n=1 Tax=Armadillidium nasatum TaxID=96803 RepID=A0A5N5SSV4_9CRUS|nr:Leucine carboxyl methyltransferase 1 [Armadillidium nasatum]
MEAIPRDACLGNDDAVIATNDDASTCKRCAVDLGYWSDPYIHYFVKSTDRKAPEINRGYYARTIAIQSLVEKFIDITSGKCQIVNIGAGFDTLYWRLKDSGRVVKEFYELDFPSVTSRKCLYIQRSKPLLQGISHEDHDIKLNRNNLHAYNYKLIGVDLRNLKEVEEKLKESDIEFQIPTIFLAECVLVYMNITKSSQLLRWITQSFKSVLFINYEMVNLHDRFGEVMLNNLRCRGCDLQGAETCRDLNTQETRFTKEGWAGAEASDMLSIWGRLPPEEISRVTQIEMLDEQELLLQLFSHYCITLAWNDSRWAEVQL